MKRVIIASHRGCCAGVERAIETVERALELYGPPIYVRKQIVHNTHVVRDLEARGAIFVESTAAVPRGERLVLAAHGVAPEVYRNAAARDLATIDATCPLVKKVHAEVRHFADAGYGVILIGHDGHEEVVGTTGEAPEAVVLVETLEQAHTVEVPDPQRVAYVTQTTLSIDETAEIIAALRERFPKMMGPRRDDICYATTNRHLDGLETAGLTSGASAPEKLLVGVCDWFRARGVTEIAPFASRSEGVFFKLPAEVSRAAHTAA